MFDENQFEQQEENVLKDQQVIVVLCCSLYCFLPRLLHTVVELECHILEVVSKVNGLKVSVPILLGLAAYQAALSATVDQQ